MVALTKVFVSEEQREREKEREREKVGLGLRIGLGVPSTHCSRQRLLGDDVHSGAAATHQCQHHLPHHVVDPYILTGKVLRTGNECDERKRMMDVSGKRNKIEEEREEEEGSVHVVSVTSAERYDASLLMRTYVEGE